MFPSQLNCEEPSLLVDNSPAKNCDQSIFKQEFVFGMQTLWAHAKFIMNGLMQLLEIANREVVWTVSMVQPTAFVPTRMSYPHQLERKFGRPSLSGSVASHRTIVVMLMVIEGGCNHTHQKVVEANEGLFSEKTAGS